MFIAGIYSVINAPLGAEGLSSLQISLCNLCVLCVSVVDYVVDSNPPQRHRDPQRSHREGDKIVCKLPKLCIML